MRAASRFALRRETMPHHFAASGATLAALRELLREDARVQGLREVEALRTARIERMTLLPLNLPAGLAAFAQLAADSPGTLPDCKACCAATPTGRKETVPGRRISVYQAAGNEYRVSHGSFFQVNRFMMDKLTERVRIAAGEGAVAMDLFSGVGLFSLPLAKNFEHVFAVESNLARHAIWTPTRNQLRMHRSLARRRGAISS